MLHLTDAVEIVCEYVRIGVHQDAHPHKAEEINGLLHPVTGKKVLLQKHHGLELSNLLELRGFHLALVVGHQHGHLPGSLKGRRHLRKAMEGLGVQEGVHARIHLGVPGHGTRQGHPRTRRAVAAAVHFHQARPSLGHHHLRVGGTVGDAQGIQTAASVGDELLGYRAVGQDALLPEAHEASAVGRAAVIDPDHGGLVHAIAGDMIHDVLRALEILL